MECLIKTDISRAGMDYALNHAEPQCGANDVKIKVLMSSVCGTDKSIFQSDKNQGIRDEMQRYKSLNEDFKPIIVGHEFCGIVEEIGSAVKSLTSSTNKVDVGDYVTAEMHLNCGMCNLCLTNQAHICTNVLVKGVHLDGCFGSYVVVPHQNVILLGKNQNTSLIPPKIGSMLDAFGNSVHTVSRINMAGKTVCVLGLGPLGLMSVMLAKHFGASTIYASETTDTDRRFKLAYEFGADYCFDVSKGSEELYSTIKKNENNSNGVDCVLEMSGSPYAYNDAFKIIANGGKVILLGISRAPLKEFDIANNIIWKGVTVEGIFGRQMFSTWSLMLNILKSDGDNLIPKLDKILSPVVYPLNQFETAFNKLITGEEMKLAFSLS